MCVFVRKGEEVFICAKMSAFCVLAYSICASDGKVPSEVKEKERKRIEGERESEEAQR
jgi:hypothetical protein